MGSASATLQTSNIMVRFEEYISDGYPDLVIVYGDVNSTIAASLVCARHGIVSRQNNSDQDLIFLSDSISC